ncbi:MAG: PCP reductase family protein [Proteobacteria bacterium]|nr:PCP reductase family protein [Pseudomonadota bacterium]
MSSEKELQWTPGAEEMLKKIPVFARPMAKMSIEKLAREKKVDVIDEALMAEAQKKSMG